MTPELIYKEINPIEEEIPWCLEHNQPLQELWIGEEPLCEACFVESCGGGNIND